MIKTSDLFGMFEFDPFKAEVNSIWRALDYMRGYINASDYDLILYLLTLHKKGVFNDVDYSTEQDWMSLISSSVNALDKDDKVRIIFPIYEPIINKLENSSLQSINELIRFSINEVFQNQFFELFEAILLKLIKAQGRFSSESLLPANLCRIALTLIDLPQNAKVYNPFSGIASFGVLFPKETTYLGQEGNKKAWAIGLMRLIANNRDQTSFLVNEDPIENWGMISRFSSDIGDRIFPREIFKNDLVIATPPFGMRLSKSVGGQHGLIRNCEQYLLEKGVEVLKENGKLVAIIGEGFLFRSGYEQSLRRSLVFNDLVETVISFPGGLLSNSGIAVSIIVINKSKRQKGFVRLINAKSFIKTTSLKERILDYDRLSSVLKSAEDSEFSKIVSNKAIGDDDYNLSVQRYFKKKYDGKKLIDISNFIIGERNYEGSKGKFVRIRDLKEDAINYTLNPNAIEISELPRNAQRIDESCLLMTGRWKTLKPTLFVYTGTPIYLSPDILAFKVDENKCDIAYLIKELHSDYVNEQLGSFRVGSVIPMIKREDLLSIEIALPELEEQKVLVRIEIKRHSEEKKKELALFNKIHGLEAEIVEQNSYLRHTLAGPSSNLKDSVSNLKKIISEQVLPKYPGLLELKLSDKHLISFGDYLNIIERDASKIANTVKSQLKVDTGIDAKKVAIVDIIDFLDKYSKEYNSRNNINFKVEFEIDKEVFLDVKGNAIRTFIQANNDLLRDLFDNLIDNASKHAFTPGTNHRVEIFLMKNSENVDRDEIQISVSNTGKPFPEGFTKADFIRKDSKSGSNAGDGFGGWYINEIIKRFDGDFDIIDETGPEGLPDTDLATSFEITFPIIETDENV